MRDRTRTNEPPHLYLFWLSFAFFAAGVCCFLFALYCGFRHLPDLAARQAFRSPRGLLLAHTLLLGWATMTAMGASYQITQVLLRTPITSRRLGIAHLVLYAVGVVLLLMGLSSWMPMSIAAGGSLVALGVIAYIVNVVLTYLRTPSWTPVIIGSCLSLFDLAATVLLGLLMGIMTVKGYRPVNYDMVLASHIWLGVVGWMAGLVVSYSFKLLPMFFVSKKKTTNLQYVILAWFQAGVWLSAAAIWTKMPLLGDMGAWLLAGSLTMLAYFTWEVRKQSSGKQPVGAVRVAEAFIYTTFAAALIWTWAEMFADQAVITLLVPILILYLVFGWFSASILAYMSKIVPFLWWAYRFRTKEQKKGAVLLANMVAQSRMTLELSAYAGGVGLLLAGIGLAWSALTGAGLAIMIICAALYVVEAARTFRF